MNEYQEQYFWSLIDAGLPEVYAWMAAANHTKPWQAALGSLSCAFVWSNTPEGHDFWTSIANEFEGW